jgi:hypothetical protein
VFFDRQDASSLAEAIQRFERQEWSAKGLRSHAERFGIDVFQSRFRQFLAKVGAPLPEFTPVSFVTPAAIPRAG